MCVCVCVTLVCVNAPTIYVLLIYCDKEMKVPWPGGERKEMEKGEGDSVHPSSRVLPHDTN